MAATNPNGDEKYWSEGTSFKGITKNPIDEKGEKYWYQGSPYNYLIPQNTATTSGFFFLFD